MTFRIKFLKYNRRKIIQLNNRVNYIGHLTYTKLPSKIVIDHLKIVKKYRGLGYGQRLIDNFNYLNPNKPVELYAYQKAYLGNGLVDFFQKMGFKIVSRPDVTLKYADTDDLIEIVKMRREIKCQPR